MNESMTTGPKRFFRSVVGVGSRLVAPRKFLSRFTRVTSSGRFISEIDGLRFIAIGSVILFHLAVNLSIKAPGTYAIPSEGNWLAETAKQGFHGVELFFVISGFILAYPFASHYIKGKQRVDLKQYFVRRLTRLEPPYILCMILFFFLLMISNRGTAAGLFPNLAASLVYLHNLVFGQESAINNVAWSLEIEIQFYALVPLLALIFAIRSTALRRSLIIGASLVLVAIQWMFIGTDHRLYLSIFRFLQFFLAGFLLADVYLVNWNEMPARGWKWDLVSLVGWPVLIVVWSSPELSAFASSAGNGPVIEAFFFPVCTFFLYCAVFRGVLTNKIMTNPWITTIGGMCYTIYLFHNKIMGVLIEYTKGFVPTGDYTVNLVLQGLIVVPMMIALCAVYFVTVERPCMRKDWPKRLLDRVRQTFSREPRKIASPVSDRV